MEVPLGLFALFLLTVQGCEDLGRDTVGHLLGYDWIIQKDSHDSIAEKSKCGLRERARA